MANEIENRCAELKQRLYENEIVSTAREDLMVSVLKVLVDTAEDEPEKIRRTLLIKKIGIEAALRRVVNTYAAGCGEEYAQELPEILRKLDSVLDILNTIPVNAKNE